MSEQSHLVNTYSDRGRAVPSVNQFPMLSVPEYICALLTQVTDVLSQLLEGAAEAFGILQHLWGIHNKHHAVDSVSKTRCLHVAHGLWAHWLVWAELEERRNTAVLLWLMPPWITGHAYYTLCPSGTWPLMTHRMSWSVGPIISPSPRPIVSHSTSSVWSFPFWARMLKDCSWRKQINHHNSNPAIILTCLCLSRTFLVKLVDEEPTMARLVTLPLNTDWTELMKLDFPELTGPRRRTRAWVTSPQLGL